MHEHVGVLRKLRQPIAIDRIAADRHHLSLRFEAVAVAYPSMQG